MKSRSAKNRAGSSQPHFEQTSELAAFCTKKANLQTNMITRQSNHHKNTRKSNPSSKSRPTKPPLAKASSINYPKQQRPSLAKTKVPSSLNNKNPESKPSSKSKPTREKKLKAYFKAKVQNLSQTVGLDTTKSFFPLTHEPPQPVSYFVQSSPENQHRTEEPHLFDSQEVATSQMLDLNYVRNVRQFACMQPQDKNVYSQVEELGSLSKNNWQAFETLKLQNEELNNYIEQLVHVEEKLRAQNEQLKAKLASEQPHAKEAFKAKIAQLTLERLQVTQNNASLQEMLNQTKLQSDSTRNKCLQLQLAHRASLQRQKELCSERAQHLSKIQLLSNQLQQSRRNVQELSRRNCQIQDHLRLCREQKDRIRQNAVDLLQMVQQLKQQEE